MIMEEFNLNRKEQIEAQAKVYANLNGSTDYEKRFIESMTMVAIRWADETFLNKAVDVLIDMSNEGKIDLYNHEEFEQNFRKAMEE